MKRAFAILIAVFAASSQSIAKDDIVGMPLSELIACAGIPASQMQVGGDTFLQYSDGMVTAGAQQFGAVTSFQRHSHTCDAIVTVSNGVVTGLQFKKRGGLISREVACRRLFKDCR